MRDSKARSFYLLVSLAYFAAYVPLDAATQLIQTSQGAVPWYPPAGLRLALLLGLGLRFYPLALAASVVNSYWIWHLAPGPHNSYPFLYSLLSTLSYLAAAWWLRRAVRINPRLSRLRDVGWFAVTVPVAACGAGLSFALTQQGGGALPAALVLGTIREFTVGDTVGVYAVTPLLLTTAIPWVNRRFERQDTIREYPGDQSTSGFIRLSPAMWGEIIAWALVTATTLWLALQSDHLSPGNRLYLTFVPLIWIALRHGIAGSAAAVFLTELSVIVSLWLSGFALGLVEVQLYALALALTGMFLGAAVTEHKAAREMWRRYEFIANTPRELMALINRDYRYEAVNDAYCRAHERTREELIGRLVIDVWGKKDFHGRIEPNLVRCFQGETVEAERWVTLPAHGRRYIAVTYTPFWSDRLSVTHAVLVVRDITDVKNAIDTLQHTERLYRRAIAAADAVAYIRDYSEGPERYTYLGQEIERMTGYPAATITPQFWDTIEKELVLLGDQAGLSIEEAIRRTRSGEFKRWRSDSLIVAADDSERWISDASVEIFDDEGEVTGCIGIMMDVTDRKRVEEALRSTEKRWRTYIDAADDLIFVLDPNGRFTLVNEAVCLLSGYTREELIGRNALEFVASEFRPHLASSLARLMRGQYVERVEFDIVSKAGEHIPTELRGRNIGEGDAIQETVHIGRDMTERKRVERALAASERHQALILRSLPMAVYTRHLASPYDITWVSDNVERIAGFPAMFFLGDPEKWTSRLHPDDRDRALQGLSRVKSEDHVEVEYRWQCKDGRYQWFLDQPTVFADDAGQPSEVIGTWLNITERKAAEEALRQSEERLELALHGADLGLWDWDIKAGIVTINDRFAEMLGFDPKEVVKEARHWVQRIHPDDYPRVQETFRAHLAGRTPLYECALRMRTKSNEWKWVVHRAKAVEWDSQGNAMRVVGTHLDVTEQKEAEEVRQRLEQQIQHAQKLESLGVLAGGIAHDFNNLLVGILGNADLALSDLPGDSPNSEYLQSIVTSAQRAAELCRQMLAYSGRGHFVVQPLNLSDVVHEMAHLLSVSVSKKVEVKFDFDPSLPPINADGTQIRQVIMNLITNASEAIGDERGVVTVRTMARQCDVAFLRENYLGDKLPAGLYVMLEIADTGCGMDDETQKRLFDPFFTTKFTGRGLGMAAVLGIVRGHLGAVKVHSETGEGTTFSVLFPACGQSLDAPGERPASEPAWRGQGTVLVVDDEEQVRNFAGRILERAGFRVLRAADGREAIDIFRENAGEIVFVLLDMTMPNVSGHEAFRVMRSIRPDVRVILSSGYSEQDATSRFGEEGLSGFLQKPYQAQVLLNEARRVLET